MKHFVLLVLFSLAFYFAWSYAAKQDKKRIKRFGMRHALAVITVLGFALAGLVLMFYSRAIGIL